MSAVFSELDEFTPDRQVAQLRVPPHSIEGESSVLGGLLLDNDAWDRVGDILQDGDFYRYEHKLIYAAIGALVNASKPADYLNEFKKFISSQSNELPALMAVLTKPRDLTRKQLKELMLAPAEISYRVF